MASLSTHISTGCSTSEIKCSEIQSRAVPHYKTCICLLLFAFGCIYQVIYRCAVGKCIYKAHSKSARKQIFHKHQGITKKTRNTRWHGLWTFNGHSSQSPVVRELYAHKYGISRSTQSAGVAFCSSVWFMNGSHLLYVPPRRFVFTFLEDVSSAYDVVLVLWCIQNVSTLWRRWLIFEN